jgi:hypothetical protein
MGDAIRGSKKRENGGLKTAFFIGDGALNVKWKGIEK